MFWSVGADKEVGAIEAAHESIVWALSWHPAGHILCSGKLQIGFQMCQKRPFLCHKNDIFSLAFINFLKNFHPIEYPF